MLERGRHELRVLTQLAPACAPRLLAHGEDPELGVLLLLEDLTDAEPGDILAGASEDQARAAVEVLGRLHATRWPDLSAWRRPRPAYAPEALGAAVEVFCERHGRALHPTLRRLAEQVPAALDVLANAPQTLVHSDAHLDNWLFGERTVLIDWQTARAEAGVLDLCRFLLEGPKVQTRRRVQAELLEVWREATGASAAQLDSWLRAALWRSLASLIPHHAALNLDTLSRGAAAVHQRCAEQALALVEDLLT